MKANCMTLLMLTGFFFCWPVLSQDKSHPENEKWVRIANEEISFTMPPDFLFDRERNYGTQKSPTVFGFRNGVWMEFVERKVSSPVSSINSLRAADSSAVQFTKGDFKGAMATRKTPSQYVAHLFLASKKRLYAFSVIGSAELQEEVVRFLFAIKVNGENVLKQSENAFSNSELPQSLDLESLQTSPEFVAARKQKLPKAEGKVELITVAPAFLPSDYSGYSRPAYIAERPRPQFQPTLSNTYSPTGRSYRSYFIKLKVVLKADGTIGDIVVYSNSEKEMWQACVEAVKKTKFIPAEINGQKVDSTEILDYSGGILNLLYGRPAQIPNQNLGLLP